MNLAIAADWLPTLGGAERVIGAFHDIWPDAPIFTTVARHGSLGTLDEADIRTSPLQRWFRMTGKHQPLLPFMPRAVEEFDLRPYDVVLSSSHAVGKGVIVQPSAMHVCYCHTPVRYAWEMEEQYIEDFGIPRPLRPHVRAFLSRLRRWDLTTAKRVDRFIANSRTVQERIKRIYNRDSIVIHPPAQDRFFEGSVANPQPSKPFLAFGRLVPYKRFDLLIQAANTLKFPLVIAGTGQDEDRLKRMAGSTVSFRGYVEPDDVADMYKSSRALLYPQLEDAGVIPLEAQACGLPVIAYGNGGALDTVRDGETGVFFDEQSAESLAKAMHTFGQWSYDPERLRTHAREFKESTFAEKIKTFVESNLG